MNFFNLAKKFLFVTFFIFILLLLILVYRAFIIFKPCQHHINPIDESERLKVTNDQIKRLQKAITFPTVSYSIGYENKEDKFEFVKYIRTGLNLYFFWKEFRIPPPRSFFNNLYTNRFVLTS